MSLKAFHILFVVLSFVLMLGFGAWALNQYFLTSDTTDVYLSVLAFVSALALLIYGGRVYKQFKQLGKNV
jgi:hypothetical protein